MKFFVSSKISLVLFGFVAAIVVGSGSAKADFIFGTPTNLGPTVNSSASDYYPRLSADGLELFFTSRPPGGLADIWVTKRATTEDEWSDPVNLGPTVNSSSTDGGPCLPGDGLSLFFYSWRPDGYGRVDIWVTTRTTTEDEWGTPVNIGPPVNSSGDEMFPSISSDGLQLYFSEWEVFRPGGEGLSDIWVTTRATVYDPWGTPVNLGPIVNSSSHDDAPFISADGLALFFCSMRQGGLGGVDLWVTTRPTTEDYWVTPANLRPAVNSSGNEEFPSISADGSTLYFDSDWPGGVGSYDLWQVPILLTITAYNPNPANYSTKKDFPGGLLGTSLGWTAGDTAVSHDVYFGENFDDVSDGTGDTFRGNQTVTYFLVGYGYTPGDPLPGGFVPGATYYWRIDEIEADGVTKYTGDVWNFTVADKKAYDSSPPDGSKFIDPNTDLS
jgi:Tol biopolymer transport system component